jgi:FtsZ-interacting cell division protein ZipA
MDALRLILLGAGLLFLALLAWLGSRRPRRVAPGLAGKAGDLPAGQPAPEAASPGAGPADTDILPGEDGMVARRSAATPASLDALGAMTSTPGPAAESPFEASLTPPVIDWSDAVADAAAAEQAEAAGTPHATLIDVPVMSQAPEARRGPPRGTAPAAAPGTEPELFVAWPPEPERHIVSLRVLGARGERIPGRLLRQGLAATGFRHGPFGIYHVGHEDGRVLISAASLVRPGLLDPDNMDFQHYPGVNLFTVLPAPLAPAELLERFCATAFDLAERIEGSVHDEGGAPLGVHESQDWRARCIATFAQHAGAH